MPRVTPADLLARLRAMTNLIRPHLTWVDTDILVDIAVKRFEKAALAAALAETEARVEPTLAIVRSALTGVPLSESNELDVAVSLTKTIQNAVGLFHQDVLGSVLGWQTTGSSGGVVDLKGTSPVLPPGRAKLVAEVKMRYNTIKASDEKEMWDKIDAAARVMGAAAGYIFQIIPKSTAPYDRPWVVSGRTPNERVRAADGVTAYHIVTGVPNALNELIHAMPYVMTMAVARLRGDGSATALQFQHDQPLVTEIIESSLPSRSVRG